MGAIGYWRVLVGTDRGYGPVLVVFTIFTAPGRWIRHSSASSQ
jgi:hypothetical protein